MRRLLLLAAALAATPVAAELRVGDLLLQPADILDARASPAPDGKAGLLVTLTPEAGEKLLAVTEAAVGRTIPVSVDGRLLAEPRVLEPIRSALTIDARLPTEDAVALARTISGKDPLPDEFED